MIFSDYTTGTIPQILNKLSSSESGLSIQEVERRKGLSGLNILSKQNVTAGNILMRQFKSPFFYLLFFAILLSLLLKDWINASMIFFFVLINVVLGFLQEYKSEQTVKLLKKYIFPKSKVVRNGKPQIINAREIVTGDIVTLEPGDIIPADVRIIKSDELLVDESPLTGESIPIEKHSLPLSRPANDMFKASNIGFSGTSVISGKASAVVFAIGKNSSIGKIAKTASETKKESTYEKEIYRFSIFILKLVIITLAIIMLANMFIKGSGIYHIEFVIFAIALAVSVIPEALPVVMTFSFSKSALTLSKYKIIVKRLSAVEDLGSVEILCTDKTGTLTENKLRVGDVFGKNPDMVIKYAYLALYDENIIPKNINSFEQALKEKTSGQDIKPFKTLKKIPFDPVSKVTKSIYKTKDKQEIIICGAYENVIKLSGRKTGPEKKFYDWATHEGKNGNRILAVAYKTTGLRDNLQDSKSDFEFKGAVSFSDPIKNSAFDAVNKAEKLGVEIKIITGDAGEVAGTVAHQIGLIDKPEEYITGENFDRLQFFQKKSACFKYKVFARITPQQKYEIINILKEKKEVGFLGEGINDAQALKSANVALVVDHASDIARQEADIVLLKKDLNNIIDGIKEGREIMINTSKYITTTLASNFGNFYSVAIVSLFVNFLPMLPTQLLLLNLLSDFPMISIATDNCDKDELVKPKKYDVSAILHMSVILGIVSTLFDFITFGFFLPQGKAVLQTSWFIGSVLTELMLIYSVRTNKLFFRAPKPSLPITVLSVVAIIITFTVPFTKLGNDIFLFATPRLNNLITVIIIAGVYFMTTEAVKRMYLISFSHPKKKALLLS